MATQHGKVEGSLLSQPVGVGKVLSEKGRTATVGRNAQPILPQNGQKGTRMCV